MKHTFFVILMIAFLCVSFGCDKIKGKSSSQGKTFSKEASYALGMNVGTGLKADNLYPDMNEFVKGIKDTLYDNSKPRYTMEEAYQVFNEAFIALEKEREAVSRQPENDFLAENSNKPGVIVTESGLQYEVLVEGSGEKPTADSMVRAHYEGTLIDGTVFDSSYSEGEPIEFPLYGVISGWTEALQLMNVGSKYRLVIPSDLGYGPQGRGAKIPPYSTLIFDVELLDIIQ